MTTRVTSAPIVRDRRGQFARLDGELWLARRLGTGRLPESLFDGLTDGDERKRRLRQAIRDRQVANMRCCTSGVTFAQAFERLYGEAL